MLIFFNLVQICLEKKNTIFNGPRRKTSASGGEVNWMRLKSASEFIWKYWDKPIRELLEISMIEALQRTSCSLTRQIKHDEDQNSLNENQIGHQLIELGG